MEFEETDGILHIRFISVRDQAPEANPGLRLRFDAPGWDHVYGLGPRPDFDSAGRTVKIDQKVEGGAIARVPVAFGRRGSWLAVAGGGALVFDFASKCTDIRCSSIPSELAICASGSPAGGMSALTGYRSTPGQGRRLQPLRIGREEGLKPRSLLGTILSLSFVGEGMPYIPVEPFPGDSRVEEEHFRFAAEISAFGPIFSVGRSGAALRPVQTALLDRMSEVFELLAPYRKQCEETWIMEGIPIWSHPGIRNPLDEALWSLNDELMFGPDLLLAPTLETDGTARCLRLPGEEWVHLWTSRKYGQGSVAVDAPVGLPAVFYRGGSRFAALFDGLRKTATRL